MIRSYLIFFLFALSCNSVNQKVSQNMIPFDILFAHEIGGKTTQEILLVTDKEALNTIYTLISKNQQPSFDLPEIDFELDMIVVFFMGEKTTGGHGVTVNKIQENSSTINIHYSHSSPNPTDMVTLGITQPYCIVKMPKNAKELKFIKQK